MSEDRAVTTNLSEYDQPEGYVRPQLLDDFVGPVSYTHLTLPTKA